jgi:hypothetical protein
VRKEPRELQRELTRTLRYYGSHVHSAAFALPVFVRKMMEDAAV